jgi:hypothetical protein
MKKAKRQGDYARKILGTLGLESKESIFQWEATDPAYIGPQNALESQIATLHKYRPLGNTVIRPDGTTATQAVVQLVEQRYLWAASPEDLNDVFELRIRPGVAKAEEYQRFIEHVTQLLENTPHADMRAEILNFVRSLDAEGSELVHRVMLEMLEQQWKRTRIISLSARRNDPLMWAHYAASHAGVCLGFRVRPMTMFAEALPVTYHETPPVFTLGTMLFEQMHEATVLCKHQRWSYEDEWRIVIRRRDHTEVPGAWKFGYNDLAEVVFGLRVDAEAEQLVRAAAASLPSVRFGRTRKVDTRDELEVAWDS